MKKFLSVFFCLILVFSMVTVCGVSADTVPVITVAGASAQQGDTVKVEISIANNPGIMGMTFCVTYNTNAFEYVDYEEGYLSNYSLLNHADKGEISFVNIESGDISEDGIIVSILFKVKETAEFGEYEIGIANKDPQKYGESLHDCFSNSKEQVIVPVVNKGYVKVIDVIIGDVNGDAQINTRDYASLIQYLNGWDVTIDEIAADVNADGQINTRDYALLIQYLNGWDVKLG